ncbi:MATE family efflux transporter [Proteus terrae]|uniref:MATE family efflux transporter n=1 Tax=Proteus terrae TaxID=1574161 RepID=UPI00132FB9A3|nr:MATE family efflux transporter [Proteus terrae]QKD71057.1 MATE family efflux transporter [Proteus terrae subsp. cibarius]QKD72884.1 MATE family efflux transporter [Proteus terrae subsp. cibarius]UDF26031.1 MATE family efflux transporter [Proteus terrae subsp. cibarius]WCG86960.1 MATE family efflux transporter [Proteus terrae]
MTYNKRNKTIIKNTLFLYFRMVLILGVSLYTSRVILKILGIEDFGIYNVVGGVVTMLTFISGAMTSATQRFLSFEIGKKNKERLLQTFRMSINIHIIITIFIIIISESIGVWFINNYLSITPDRMLAANFVFQYSLLSFCFVILSTPYKANLIAHEKMNVFAYISIIDILLKLGAVLILDYISGDKLTIYSTLIAIISILIFCILYIYNKLKFTTTSYKIYWNNELFYSLFSYTGWNLFGNMASVGMNQGINILLNIFFGPIINAARAISFQVNSAVNGFVTNLQSALSPQIVKSYANNDIYYLETLVLLGSRFSFFLIFFLSLPILLKPDTVLSLWLNNYPPYTSIFCQLILIDSLINSLSGTLMSAFQASGKIKKYQITIGSILLLNIPISYFFLYLGLEATVTFLVCISLSLVSLFIRLLLLNELFPGISRKFYKNVFWRILVISSISYYSVWLIIENFEDNLINFLITCIISWFVITINILFFGLSYSEKLKIRKFLVFKFRKIKEYK